MHLCICHILLIKLQRALLPNKILDFEILNVFGYLWHYVFSWFSVTINSRWPTPCSRKSDDIISFPPPNPPSCKKFVCKRNVSRPMTSYQHGDPHPKVLWKTHTHKHSLEERKYKSSFLQRPSRERQSLSFRSGAPRWSNASSVWPCAR